MIIVPRSDIGLPAPPATRSKMAKGTRHILVHYTGVPGYNDPAKDLQYSKSVAWYGMNKSGNKNPYEYNYHIGLGGGVFEQAGEYRAGHCLNFSTQSYGILLMLGIGVHPTAAMIASFHELVAWLKSTGAVSQTVELAPHYRYRSTICPNTTLAEAPGAAWPSPTGEGRLGKLLPALLNAPPMEDDMPRSVNARVLDTRIPGEVMLADGETRGITVAAPSDKFATVHVTCIPQGTKGYLKVYQPFTPEPNTSVTNWPADGAPVNGSATVALLEGKIVVKAVGGPCHLIVDTQVVW